MDKIKVMESLIGRIHKLSVALKDAPDGTYDVMLWADDSEQLKRAAEELNVFLYHPCEAKPYYWFIYDMENDYRKKISIKVKGSYI